MHKHYHLASNWTDRARLAITILRLAPRWLHIFIILFLIAGIGGTLQTVAAQAGLPTTVTYVFDVDASKTSLCLGQTVSYKVSVKAKVVVQGDPAVSQYRLVGASFTQKVLNSSILRDSQSVPTSPAATTEMPLSFTFTFKAVGLGRTAINLDAEIVTQSNTVLETAYTLHDAIEVRVVPCRLKVITNARWFQSLGQANITAYAVVANGEMLGDENGYYSGTAKVVWIVKAFIPGCGQTNTLKYGTVEMKGKIDDSEQLHVDLDYLPLSGSEIVNCPGLGTGGGAVFAAAAPLKVQLPNFGGVVQLSQTLRNPNFSVDTLTYVYIVPVPINKP